MTPHGRARPIDERQPPNGDRRRRRDTLLTHTGGKPKDRHGAVNPPVYRASTILFPTVAEWEASREHERRFDVIRYGQLGTPTTFALEEAIATLEGGYRAMLLPSGLAAATTALLALLESGDHLLMTDSAYAPTRHFCKAILPRYGITTTFYDPCIGAGIAELMRPRRAWCFVESPGSITFEVQDVPAIADVAHERGRGGRDGQHVGDAVLLPGHAARRRRLDHRGDEIHWRPCGRHARHDHDDAAAVRAAAFHGGGARLLCEP